MVLGVKDPLAVWETQETQVQSLGRKDPLEQEIATQSSILAGITSWTEEPKESDRTEQLSRQACTKAPVHSETRLGRTPRQLVIPRGGAEAQIPAASGPKTSRCSRGQASGPGPHTSPTAHDPVLRGPTAGAVARASAPLLGSPHPGGRFQLK